VPIHKVREHKKGTTVEDKTLDQINTIDELIHCYQPKSKYSDLWIELKYKLSITVQLKGKLDYETESKQYRRALFRLHQNDMPFRQYCIGKYGTELTPASLTKDDKLIICLYNANHKLYSTVKQMMLIEKLN